MFSLSYALEYCFIQVAVRTFGLPLEGGFVLYRLKLWTFFTVYSKNGKSIGYFKNFTSYTDKAVDYSGIVFCKELSKEPQTLENLVKNICQSYTDAKAEEVRNDAINFYAELENDGFIVSGETVDELNSKDSGFSFSAPQNIEPSGIKMNRESGWSLMCKELGGAPLLLETQIELTNRCNERCVHCYLPISDRKSSCDIDIEPLTFYSFVKQAKELGMLSISITGGEPMLHKNFLEFLRYVKANGFAITLFTNLTMLTDEIMNELISPQIIAVRVSLYSMDACVHDDITKIPGSFRKTFSNIQKLMKYNIPVQINTPIMKQNKDTFMDVVKWGQNNNVRVVADYRIFATYDLEGKEQLSNRLSLQDLEPVIRKLLPTDFRFIAEKKKLQRKEHNFENELCCGCCMYTFCMNARGDVYPCNGWQNYVLGNIRETSIENIIVNSEKAIYIRNLRRKQFKKCLECKHIDFCHFCLMGNALEDKDGNMLNLNQYYCDAAALHHKIIDDAIAEEKCL